MTKYSQFMMPFCWILCALALSMTAPFFSRAAALPEVTSTEDIQQGSLLLQHPNWSASKLSPMLNTDVDIQITGLVARVTVTQSFHNPTPQWVNGIYLFPLPEDAAVDTLRMRIGERMIEGEIKAKQQARRIYEQAKREGKKASLLEQNRANMFTNRVANIGPDETVEVTIEYQQTVRYSENKFSLRFPMTVNPRYLPAEPLSAEFAASGFAAISPAAAEIQSEYTQDKSASPISIQVSLQAGMPLVQVRSPSHLISQQVQQTHHELSLGGPAVANQDFVLEWVPELHSQPQAALFKQTLPDASYGLLMLMPPQDKLAQPQAREIVLVLDTSGSMSGESIEQAKEAVKTAIRQLGPDDSFNLIEFNSYAHALWPYAQPVTHETQMQAIGFVNELRADGGTEMASALDLALDSGYPPAKLRQVVFITDGSVGNEEALMELIQAKLGDSRLFTVGIGSAPNSYFMTEAALVGRGSYTYISDLNQVQNAMLDLLHKLRFPALTELNLAFSHNTEFYPQTLPDLYLSEPLVVAFRQPTVADEVTLSGMSVSGGWSVSMSLTQAAEGTGLAKRWAREKIAELSRQRRYADDAQTFNQAIEDVALQHHLVSEFTSLVAVDVTPSKPESATSTDKKVPSQAPKGLSNQARMSALPMGATSMRMDFILALVCGVAALLLWRARGV